MCIRGELNENTKKIANTSSTSNCLTKKILESALTAREQSSRRGTRIYQLFYLVADGMGQQCHSRNLTTVFLVFNFAKHLLYVLIF